MNQYLFQHNLPWLLPVIILLAIWTLVWKGLALWRASHLNQKGWFIALLVINTLGILEIIYLAITEKKQQN